MLCGRLRLLGVGDLAHNRLHWCGLSKKVRGLLVRGNMISNPSQRHHALRPVVQVRPVGLLEAFAPPVKLIIEAAKRPPFTGR